MATFSTAMPGSLVSVAGANRRMNLTEGSGVSSHETDRIPPVEDLIVGWIAGTESAIRKPPGITISASLT